MIQDATPFSPREDTGSTVSKVLRPLLEDDAQHKVFFESMLWLLRQLKEHRPGGDGSAVPFIRHFGRVGYVGDSDLEPLDQPLALCQALVARTDRDSYVEEVLADQPTPSSVP